MKAHATAEKQASWLRMALQQEGRPFVRVTSNSMAPLLRSGDYAQIAAVELEALRPDDIVVLAHATGPISHRLWRVEQAPQHLLITKGDRLDHFDPPRPSSHLIGRVIACRRGRRRLDLEQGVGRQVRRFTGHLARLEQRLKLTGAAKTRPRTDSPATSPDFVTGRQPQWRRSRLRQSLYRLAQLTVGVAYATSLFSLNRRQR